MRPIHSATPAVLLTLLAVGCGGSTTDQKPGDSSGSTGTGAAQPKLVAAHAGRPAMLDTGIDLSHLKDASAPAGFPTRQAPQPSVAQPLADPVPTGPPGGLQIVEGQEIMDFGEMLEGEKAESTYRLKSTGENPLIIERVRPSCGCTAAEIQLVAADGTHSVYELGSPIEPGVEFELGTSINTANRSGAFASNVAIYSNDPASPLRLQLRADVKPVLSIEPQNLDLGQLTSGDMKEGMVTISSQVLDPFKLELDAANLVAPLSAELTPVDPDAEGRARTWTLAVKLGPEIPEGMRRYQLRMTSDIPQADAHADAHPEDEVVGPVADAADGAAVPTRELMCFVNANVTALVVASPNFISFGAVRPGEPMERSVKIESLDPKFMLPAEPAYRFQSITGGEFTAAQNFSVKVTPTPDSNGKALDVTVRLEGLPDDYTGSFGGMVTLEIGHPTKQEVSIRFSGVARPGIPATSQDN